MFALIIGYATAALAYSRRGHKTTLRDLRPALRCDDAELSALQREVLHFDMAELRRIGMIAALFAVVGTYFTTDAAQRLSHPALLWNLWQNALFSWLLARTIAHDLRVSRVFSQATERYAEIELFDLTPLAGRGLQSALLIVIAISLFSLFLGTGDPSPLVPLTQTFTLEIESRLATLLALKQHVGAAREWPFDLGTLGRFLLYAVIGVGSWLGAATVERLLDLLLG